MELPDENTLVKLRYDHRSNVNDLIGTKWVWVHEGVHKNKEYTVVGDEVSVTTGDGKIAISSFLANLRKYWCKSFIGHADVPCIFCDYDGDESARFINFQP